MTGETENNCATALEARTKNNITTACTQRQKESNHETNAGRCANAQLTNVKAKRRGTAEAAPWKRVALAICVLFCQWALSLWRRICFASALSNKLVRAARTVRLGKRKRRAETRNAALRSRSGPRLETPTWATAPAAVARARAASGCQPEPARAQLPAAQSPQARVEYSISACALAGPRRQRGAVAQERQRAPKARQRRSVTGFRGQRLAERMPSAQHHGEPGNASGPHNARRRLNEFGAQW